jgi:hypothetical protein
MEKEGAFGSGAGSEAKYDVDIVAAPNSGVLVEKGSCRTSSSVFFANMDCAVKKREEGIDLHSDTDTRKALL